jgi:hypothetical protein
MGGVFNVPGIATMTTIAATSPMNLKKYAVSSRISWFKISFDFRSVIGSTGDVQF